MQIELVREKETKNTVRYRAVDSTLGVEVIYLNKPLVHQLGNPEAVTLDVRAVTSESVLRAA